MKGIVKLSLAIAMSLCNIWQLAAQTVQLAARSCTITTRHESSHDRATYR